VGKGAQNPVTNFPRNQRSQKGSKEKTQGDLQARQVGKTGEKESLSGTSRPRPMGHQEKTGETSPYFQTCQPGGITDGVRGAEPSRKRGRGGPGSQNRDTKKELEHKKYVVYRKGSVN